MTTILTVVLAVAAIGYVLWSRMKGQPLRAKRLVALPVVLTIIGIANLTGSSAPHLTDTDIVFLAVSIIIAVILGAARGATIELYPRQGELWQRYRRSTVGLWIALIATKVVLLGVASAAGASAAGGTNSLLVSLGASLLAEAAIVVPRALSTGVPFAADRKNSDTRRPGWDNRMRMPAPEDQTRPADGQQWRSPSWRDGVDWLRRQLEDPGEHRR